MTTPVLEELQQEFDKLDAYKSFLEQHQKQVEDEYQDNSIHTQWKITQVCNNHHHISFVLHIRIPLSLF